MNYDCTNTTSAALPFYGNAKLDIDKLLELKKRIESWPKKPVLFIWKGDTSLLPLRDKPLFAIGQYLQDAHAVYLVAGVGLIAGKKAYEKLLKLNFELRWSQSFMELEEQESLWQHVFASKLED